MHLSKFKAFAENNLLVPKTDTIRFDAVQSFMEKGENTSFWHFLPLPQCF